MGFFSNVIHDSRRQIKGEGSAQSQAYVEPMSDSQSIEPSGKKAQQPDHQTLVEGDPAHFNADTNQRNPQHTLAASLSANQCVYPQASQATSESTASTRFHKKSIAVSDLSHVNSETPEPIKRQQNLQNSLSIADKADEQEVDVVLRSQDTFEHRSSSSEKTTLNANIEKVSITNHVMDQTIGKQSLNQNNNSSTGNQQQGAVESKPQRNVNAKVTPTEDSAKGAQTTPVVEQLLANGFDLSRPDAAETFVPSSLHAHSSAASPSSAKPASPNINIGQVNVIVEAVDTQVASSVKAPVANDNSSRVFLRSL